MWFTRHVKLPQYINVTEEECGRAVVTEFKSELSAKKQALKILRELTKDQFEEAILRSIGDHEKRKIQPPDDDDVNSTTADNSEEEDAD